MAKAAISIVKGDPVKPMSKARARALARKMVKEGKTYEQVCKELAKKGFTGPRSGKMLSTSTLSVWLSKPRKKKRRKSTERTSVPRSRLNSTNTIKAVLDFQGVPAEEKLSLIRVLVEHS
jgi:hypothetical protein